MKRLVKEYVDKHLKECWQLSKNERSKILSNIYPENKSIDVCEKVILIEFFHEEEEYPQGYEIYSYTEEKLLKLMSECSREYSIYRLFNIRVLDNKGKVYTVNPTSFSLSEGFKYCD